MYCGSREWLIARSASSQYQWMGWITESQSRLASLNITEDNKTGNERNAWRFNPKKEILLYLILAVILLFSLKKQIFHQSGLIRPVQLTAHIPLVSTRPFATPIQSKLQLRVHHIRLAAIRRPLSREMKSKPLESTLPGPQKPICNTGRRCDSTLFVEFGVGDVAPDILYELFAVVICFLGNVQPEIKLREIHP